MKQMYDIGSMQQLQHWVCNSCCFHVPNMLPHHPFHGLSPAGQQQAPQGDSSGAAHGTHSHAHAQNTAADTGAAACMQQANLVGNTLVNHTYRMSD
jgi:hypothetical protein